MQAAVNCWIKSAGGESRGASRPSLTSELETPYKWIWLTVRAHNLYRLAELTIVQKKLKYLEEIPRM